MSTATLCLRLAWLASIGATLALCPFSTTERTLLAIAALALTYRTEPGLSEAAVAAGCLTLAILF